MDTFLSTLLTMSVTAALVAGIVMLLRLVLRPLPRWITCAVSSDDLSCGAVSAGEPGTPGHHQRGLCPAPPPRRARAGPGNGPRPRHARPGRAHPFRRRRDPTGPSRASGYSTARLAHRGVGRGGRGRPALGRSLLRQTPPAGGGGRAGGERGPFCTWGAGPASPPLFPWPLARRTPRGASGLCSPTAGPLSGSFWPLRRPALRPVFSCWGTPTADWRAGPLTRGWFSPMGKLSPSQSPCWRSCWLSATDMTEIWSPCLPSPLKRTPESFSRARKTTGKFFAGTTLSWSIRLPPAEKTGNPNRTV